MSTSVKVIAKTVEQDGITKPLTEEAIIFSGKAAGVCYMPDDYLEEGIQNEEKAANRAKGNAKSGHHSVFDHMHITMIVKTSKMMCMLLNSVGVYTTSEKSARYTKMQPKTELEAELYNKWKDKIQPLILKMYPNTDDEILNKRFKKYFETVVGKDTCPPTIKDGAFVTLHGEHKEEFETKLDELKQAEDIPSYKLAQENARYMISVFTPTTMEYTVSYRQLILISDYLELLIECCDCKNTDFNKQLKEESQALLKEFNKILGDKPFRDNKNLYFRFLEAQHLGEVVEGKFKRFNPTRVNGITKGKKTYIGDTYTITYKCSFAMLAQAQRHRTLRYSMWYDGTGNIEFYVPDIIELNNLKTEWLKDLKSVKYCTPQATFVRCTEQGLFEDFELKCKERMCGRAQLEIMKNTTDTVKLFIDNFGNLSAENLVLLYNITNRPLDGSGVFPCARCKFDDFTCSEGCQWGYKQALTRHI